MAFVGVVAASSAFACHPSASHREWIRITRLEIVERRLPQGLRLVAEIGFVNDSDSTVTATTPWAGVVAPSNEISAYDGSQRARRTATDRMIQQAGLATVGPHEQHSFTAIGPALTDGFYPKFLKNQIRFFVAGTIVLRNDSGESKTEFCAYSQGPPKLTLPCPTRESAVRQDQ
jgi:hypothetical protein